MTTPNTAAQTCTNLPFGDSQSCTGTETSPLHFTGLQRDTESGLDQTWYRKYSSAQGRWLVPDPYPGSASPVNPQSFNRYSYVMNNATGFVDPAGLQECETGEPESGCEDGGLSVGTLGTTDSGACPPDVANCNTQVMVDGVVVDRSAADRFLKSGFARYAWFYVDSYEKDSRDGQGYSTDWYGVTSSQEWAQTLDFSQSAFLPNGDRRIDMDIWHCPGCRNTWQQSSKTVNVLGGATMTFVSGYGLVAAAPTATNIALYSYYVLPATPMVGKMIESATQNIGTTNGLIFRSVQVLKFLYCGNGGACDSFRTVPVRDLF